MSKVSGDPLARCLGEVVAVDDCIKQITTLDSDNKYIITYSVYIDKQIHPLYAHIGTKKYFLISNIILE